MSFVNIPVGRTKDTSDFRTGAVPDFNSLDGRGIPINQTLGFLTNTRIVANYEVAIMKDNLTNSLQKGHYLFTVNSPGHRKECITLLNLPLLNYVLANLQKPGGELDINETNNKISEMNIYKYINPVGVLVSEDSEWKAEPKRNRYMRDRQVAVGVSGMVTDIYNVWGKKVKTGTKLYFSIEKVKNAKEFKLQKSRSVDQVVTNDEIFQVIPYADYEEDEGPNFGWYVGKAATGSRKHDVSTKISRDITDINNSSKIEAFLDF
jgi:hypothetical protein